MSEAEIRSSTGNDWTWDALDGAGRTGDARDPQARDRAIALRRKVLSLPGHKRDEMRRSLQQNATVMPCAGSDGPAMLRLVAIPVVLAYTTENAVMPEPSLFRDAGSHLPERWKQLWMRLVPGARVIPASSCVLLDEVLGVAPEAVQACLLDGAAYIGGGPKPRLRLRATNPARKEFNRCVVGPAAATYLAMAFVIDQAGQVRQEPLPGALSEAAVLLQSLFANRRERPRVKVLPPAPFFESMRSATAAQLRHFVDWGNDHDPSWTLDMMEPENSTMVQVLGTYSADRGEDEAEPSVVRWTWDRAWWTDGQIAQLRDAVGAAEQESANELAAKTAPMPRACLPGERTSFLH